MYNEIEYCEKYEQLYITHPFWMQKYKCNEKILKLLLTNIDPLIWIDLFCGQGQYFSLAKDLPKISCIGVDSSTEQLWIAKARKLKNVNLVEADINNKPLNEIVDKVGLVSIMWGAYSYLSDLNTIFDLLEQISRLLYSNGKLYIEIIETSTLKSFNKTIFANKTNTSVIYTNEYENGVIWEYQDDLNVHKLFSPNLSWFIQNLEKVGFIPYHLKTIQTIHQILAIKI